MMCHLPHNGLMTKKRSRSEINAENGRKGGLVSGIKKGAAVDPPEVRSANARRAALARWAQKKSEKALATA